MTIASMTRKELESLGGNDRQLSAEYRKLTGIVPDISGDDARSKQVRRMAFDRVAAAAMTVSVQMPGEIGPFAIDDPAAHESLRSS